MSISYDQAVSLFGPNPVFELGELYRCRIVDPTISPDGIFVRLEIMFKLQEGIVPFNQAGEINSLRTSKIDLALLIDWGVLQEAELPPILQYLSNWNADLMYTRGTEKVYAWIVDGTVRGDLIEFQGPTGATCAGLVNITLEGCRIALKGLGTGQSGSEKSRNLIRKHLPSSNNELVF